MLKFDIGWGEKIYKNKEKKISRKKAIRQTPWRLLMLLLFLNNCSFSLSSTRRGELCVLLRVGMVEKFSLHGPWGCCFMIILWYTAQIQLEIMMKWKVFLFFYFSLLGGRFFPCCLNRTYTKGSGWMVELRKWGESHTSILFQQTRWVNFHRRIILKGLLQRVG